MKPFQPADHLHSRTFLGLLVAQFFAAFNDQAIHAAAMFYAINLGVMSEAHAITLMPLLFYLPWAIFPTLAGYLADRYSKRYALVIWKVVELFICLLALYGFWLGRNGDKFAGAWIVLACVFGMGSHSAFFVPAKYGVMPEILTPRMLSRGNGILESLSFLAIIAGTVTGGVLSTEFGGREYMIGFILVALAVVGAVASLFIETMPAANPSRVFPPYIYQPLWNNIRMLLSSRPLVFAVVGIAFFTFLVTYMRSVVYMHGQSQMPPWSEAYTSYIAGVVALGIGVGSPLVGYLSGGKVELGLVTVGAVGMVLATTGAAVALFNVPLLVVAIAFIGFFTGFYLVPLYSLLQHRAPKSAKGDAVATSNFLNITGAIASMTMFAVLTLVAHSTGYTPDLKKVGTAEGTLSAVVMKDGHPHSARVGDKEFKAVHEGPHYVYLILAPTAKEDKPAVARTYFSERGGVSVTKIRFQPAGEAELPFLDQSRLPSLLFLGAGAFTLLTLGVLTWILPDLFKRTVIWVALAQRGIKLEVAGLLRLPGNGPALLATSIGTPEEQMCLESAVDRVVHFVGGDLKRGEELLRAGEVVAADPSSDGLAELSGRAAAPILPVAQRTSVRGGVTHADVMAGMLLPPGSPSEAVEEELARLGVELGHKAATGEPLEKEAH
jgi:MFS family permease